MKIFKLTFILFALIFIQCSKDGDDNPDNPVRISILDSSADEGNGYVNVSVQLRLDAASDQQITANISTSDGTAVAIKDYAPVNNQAVVFTPGETQKTYEITIAGDLIAEEDEYFEVTIVSVTAQATIDKGTARIDLLNDDAMGTQTVPVPLTIDWGALVNLAPGSEAPYAVMNFGQPENIPNAEFTSVGVVSDTIFFSPKISPAGDTILYSGIFFEPGFNWPEYVDLIFMDLTPADSVQLEIKMPILNSDSVDLSFKYDLQFMVGTAQGRFGPYMIDPKIRIPTQ